MRNPNKKDPANDMLSAFEELKTMGDDILLPRSVVSDVVSERDEKSGKTVTSGFLHRYDFGDFFISLVYTPNRSALTAVPSVLEARIVLDKAEPLFFLTPYDVIPYINSADLICRYFPYIESPERLRSCYHDLAESLVPYLADFARIAANQEDAAKAYQNMKGEMVRCYGQNIFLASGKGEDYDYALTSFRFAHFIKWKSSIFSSPEYNEFLVGNYTNLSSLASRKNMPDYIRHITLSAAALSQAPVQVVKPESASLSAMVEASRKATSIPLLILSCLISLPFITAGFALLYFVVASILGQGADVYTALTVSGFLRVSNWIIFAALLLADSSCRLLLRLFCKKRYAAYRPYLAMQKQNSSRTLIVKLKKIVLFVSVLMAVLAACRGVVFSGDRIIAQQGFLPFESEQYTLDEIEKVTQYTRRDGSFYYEITFSNGSTLSLEEEMTARDCEKLANALQPIFEDNKITVTDPDETTPPGKDAVTIDVTDR